MRNSIFVKIESMDERTIEHIEYALQKVYKLDKFKVTEEKKVIYVD